LTSDPEREHWLRRLDATGRAQARYLWLTLVSGLFYASLRFGSTPSQTVTVPVVDLDLDALSVQASGGPIIAFLVLASVGAIRAWAHALEEFRGVAPAKDSEQLDTYPNALDLAVYTTDRSPKVIRKATYFVYPAFLIAALVESGWLLLWTWTTADVPWRVGFLIAGASVWLPASALVLAMLWKRIRQVPQRG
jgi:hypothetical protein